jgi:hypothetical protein
MRLSLPFVLGIDKLVDENPIQRIAVMCEHVEFLLWRCCFIGIGKRTIVKLRSLNSLAPERGREYGPLVRGHAR